MDHSQGQSYPVQKLSGFIAKIGCNAEQGKVISNISMLLYAKTVWDNTFYFFILTLTVPKYWNKCMM